MNLPPPHLRLVIPPCFDPCRSLLGRIVARPAADARQAEAFLVLTVAMIVLAAMLGGYLGWALVPPGSRTLFTAILGGALFLIAASLIGRRPAIIIQADRDGVQIRHARRVRTRARDSSTRGFRADAEAVEASAVASTKIARDLIDFPPGAPALQGASSVPPSSNFGSPSESASDARTRTHRMADRHPPNGAHADVLLHIPYSSIERTARIDGLTFHRHYRRFAQTRVFVNRMPSELILMRVGDLDAIDHGSVENRRGGGSGGNSAACRGIPIILGLADESDRAAFEAFLAEVANVAPASSWADVV